MNLLDSIVQNMQAERSEPVKPVHTAPKVSMPQPPITVLKRRSTCRWIVRIDGQPINQGWRANGWRDQVRTVLTFHRSIGANATLHIDRYSSRYRTTVK